MSYFDIDEYVSKGYTVVRDLISKDVCRSMMGILDELESRSRTKHHCVEYKYARLNEEFYLSANVTNILTVIKGGRSFSGSKRHMKSSLYRTYPRERGEAVTWHTDGGIFNNDSVVTAILYLTHVREVSDGPTYVWPEPRDWKTVRPSPMDALKHEIPILAEPGDVLFMSGQHWHRGSDVSSNSTPRSVAGCFYMFDDANHLR